MQRASALVLLIFAVAGLAGGWRWLPAGALLLGLAWLPGRVALELLRPALAATSARFITAGPSALVFALSLSLLMLTLAVLPLFAVGASLAAAVPLLGAIYLIVAALVLVRTRAIAERPIAWQWLVFAAVVVALLPAVLTYAGGTVDDWWDLAFVRAYASRAELAFDEPILGSGNVHPRFVWNGWLVLQALVVELSAIDPAQFQSRWLAPFVCALSVAGVAALALAVFGARRRLAVTASLVFVPFWLFGTEALPYFTRLHQDKFVAAFVLVPAMLAAAVAYLATPQVLLAVLLAAVALATVSVHGLVFAVGVIGVGACALAALSAGERKTTLGPLAAALLPAALYPLWQASVLRGWFAAQGIGMAAADNPVVRAHLRLERLLWPDSVMMVVDPRAVFGPVAAIAVLGLAVAAWRRRERDASLLLWLGAVPSLIIFTPFLAGLAGEVIVPWMLYRVGWLVPVPLLAGLLVERAVHVARSRRRPAAWAAPVAVAIASVALAVPVALDRVQRDMLEHPFDREKQPRGTTREVYRFLADRDRAGAVVAPLAFSTLVPAMSGRATVAISERGTLVFAGDEIDAYRRLRDRAAFFDSHATAAERARIADEYGVAFAVFRRRLVTSGSDARWLSHSSAEGFALGHVRDDSRLWSFAEADVAAALPQGWQLVLTNRDFVVAQSPTRGEEGATNGRIERLGAVPQREKDRRWTRPFDVAGPSTPPANAEVLASVVGYPGAIVRFDPVPLGLGISERPVWTAGRLLWDDGPFEVVLTVELESACSIVGVEIVPFLPVGRREVFEVRVDGRTTRDVAVDGVSLFVATVPRQRRTLSVEVRSMLGVSFGLRDVRVLGARASCDGGWQPRLRPRLPDEDLRVDELLGLARAYPNSARSAVGVARRLAGRDGVSDARALLRGALDRDPGASAVWAELGLMRDGDGSKRAALRAYRRALRADSNSAWARGCMAWAQLRRGHLAPALYHGWRAVRQDPYYADAYTILAQAVEQLRWRSRARALLEYAVGLDPRRNWASLELARMLEEDGETAEAVHVLTVLLELVPDDGQAREMLARLTASSNDLS